MAVFEQPGAGASSRVWSVSALLLAAGDALAARFGSVAVTGELSSFTRAASGHCYLSLKDADGTPALLRCAMFRRAAALLDFEPRDGMLVELRGRIGLYEPRGELQLVVESMRRLGAGSLYEEFLRLRARLEEQGLFDAGRKRPLPSLPRRVAVVTSPAAAAWHDVMAAFARRSPQVELVLVPSPVQGSEAPPALVEALGRAGQLPDVDLVLLVRGGGSLEDLWAFNDERVVRAVAACARPVLCGVGHETDVTLCDLAADRRAPTPTAAAEMAAPAVADLLHALDQRALRLRQALQRQLERQAQRVDAAALRLGPAATAVAAQVERLNAAARRLSVATQAQVPRHGQAWESVRERFASLLRGQLQQQRARLDASGLRLQGIDPRAVLRRGYAWVEDERARPVVSALAVKTGAQLRAVWSDGAAQVLVQGVEPAGDAGPMDIASGTSAPPSSP